MNELKKISNQYGELATTAKLYVHLCLINEIVFISMFMKTMNTFEHLVKRLADLLVICYNNNSFLDITVLDFSRQARLDKLVQS